MNHVFTEAIEHIFANHNRSLENGRTKKGKAVKAKELEMAVAVLLVDLASCDQHFDTCEFQTISKGLNKLFGTSLQEVSQLVQQATQALAMLRGSAKFATLLKDNLPLEERKKIMEVIEDVIQADGVVDGFEIYLRHKYADLLGVPVASTAGENSGEKA